GDWYYEYVKYINEKNLMKGISETEFAPNNTVTRAMFVTVLYRLEKEPTGAKADFADVLDGTYYENAVGWAVQNGIVNGVSETEFAPDNTITREQMATIIHRYMKFKGLDMSAGENADTASFEDFENVSDYAKDAFRYACSNGIISGTSKSTLSPKESATRAQMAAIFQRCEKVLLNQ
ncbi:MAG: S-layer homology domain-containing protein, partial [Peptococcaceae bacterium]|nr:S-layer homology domain-containing protein [Peptococcaceae bacterium]